jgi:hydroxymethylbilane synthase
MRQNKIRIATRNSPLALLQTQAVIDSLLMIDNELIAEIVPIITSGDLSLKSAPGMNVKAMFVSELQQALLSDQADIAVHSLKDMAIKPQSGLAIIACMPRQDPSDAFVSNKYISLELLPAGAVVGTSSIRRKSLLQKYYPEIIVKDVRGNVDTRLRKLEESFDAIILATNGLERLSYHTKITERLPKEKFIPAIGQAVIAIEANINNPCIDLVQKINHSDTFLCVQIERHIGSLLGADCGLPIAVHVEVLDNGDLGILAMSALSDFKSVHQQTSLADLAQTVHLIINKLQ